MPEVSPILWGKTPALFLENRARLRMVAEGWRSCFVALRVERKDKPLSGEKERDVDPFHPHRDPRKGVRKYRRRNTLPEKVVHRMCLLASGRGISCKKGENRVHRLRPLQRGREEPIKPHEKHYCPGIEGGGTRKKTFPGSPYVENSTSEVDSPILTQ